MNSRPDGVKTQNERCVGSAREMAADDVLELADISQKELVIGIRRLRLIGEIHCSVLIEVEEHRGILRFWFRHTAQHSFGNEKVHFQLG